MVDDIPSAGNALELQSIGEEVGVGDVQGAGNKRRSVDAGTGADEDAGGVDEPDFAVGGELPEKDAGVVGEDAIKDGAGSGRLIEANEFVGTDVEFLPVEDGAGAVVDGEGVAGLADGGRAGNDLGADGQRHGRSRKHRHHRHGQQPMTCV